MSWSEIREIRKIRTGLAVVAACALVLPGLASAQEADGPKQERRDGPCADDRKKFCSEDPKEAHGAWLRCLTKHHDALTEECQVALDKLTGRLRQKAEAARDACKAEVAQFCADGEESNVFVCLSEHTAELSEGCREAMPQKRGAASGS